jgi:ParB-like chromosome segregation protein Spo0J
MTTSTPTTGIQIWPIDKFVPYARNPRKNDAVVDRMCGSIREFGFKIPILARSDGEVVDGHLRLKAAKKLRMTELPVILCDDRSAAQVKAFRLMVNRSVTWADFDEELLALELQDLNEADYDLSLTGFDPKEIDDLLLDDDADEKANEIPPVPTTRHRALAICGSVDRIGCCAATARARTR